MDNLGDTPTLDLGCIPEHDTADRPVNIAYALDQMMRSLLPSQNTAFFVRIYQILFRGNLRGK